MKVLTTAISTLSFYLSTVSTYDLHLFTRKPKNKKKEKGERYYGTKQEENRQSQADFRVFEAMSAAHAGGASVFRIDYGLSGIHSTGHPYQRRRCTRKRPVQNSGVGKGIFVRGDHTGQSGADADDWCHCHRCAGSGKYRSKLLFKGVCGQRLRKLCKGYERSPV